MPVPMKKRCTKRLAANVEWHGSQYSIPLSVIEKYKIESKTEGTVSVGEVFADLISERGEPGTLLRGLRAKEGLSQVNFSKIIGVTQANLSAMENGKRSIGKELAKRIAKKFKMDYRLFL